MRSGPKKIPDRLTLGKELRIHPNPEVETRRLVGCARKLGQYALIGRARDDRALHDYDVV